MEPYYAYLRMNNGDELLSLISNEDQFEMTLVKPIIVLRQMNEATGDVVLLFITWLPKSFSNAKEVTIARDKVVFNIPLNEETIETVKEYSEKGYSFPEKKIKKIVEPKTPVITTSKSETVDPFEILEDFLGEDPKKS